MSRPNDETLLSVYAMGRCVNYFSSLIQSLSGHRVTLEKPVRESTHLCEKTTGERLTVVGQHERGGGTIEVSIGLLGIISAEHEALSMFVCDGAGDVIGEWYHISHGQWENRTAEGVPTVSQQTAMKQALGLLRET